MRKTPLDAEKLPEAADLDGSPFRLRNSKPIDHLTEADDEAVAAYLLDLMVAARRMAAKRQFSFLAYLIGVAAEESRLLTLGSSAAGNSASHNPASRSSVSSNVASGSAALGGSRKG
ncbi:MAG: hypothetical protein K9G30_05745 [Parvibaculum sp.]|nr:hypothetical protein [Parvibaculum sp.]